MIHASRSLRFPPATLRLLRILALFTLIGLAPSSASAQSWMSSWANLDRSLEPLAPRSNLLVAEFRGSSCATIHGRNEATRLAIASTFKLYVLGELAR